MTWAVIYVGLIPKSSSFDKREHNLSMIWCVSQSVPEPVVRCQTRFMDTWTHSAGGVEATVTSVKPGKITLVVIKALFILSGIGVFKGFGGFVCFLK